ncbi:MAG: bifunctional DNA-formamidopyrimidine glycosylase/DNA-(apurinic or apyrimidinic site) lyase [Actinomycetota bacterium]
MPELPEVETIRRQLEPRLVGHAIVESEAHPSAKFNEAPWAAGAAFERVERRGKYLILGLDDERELVIHLGMTGQLSVADEPTIDEYVRAWWRLDDGSTFVFRDVRRFGRIRVVDRGDYATITTLHQLGPEPFDERFTPTHLHRALSASSRRIKTQLLSQRPVAGVGNIYADEALWRARVYPAARSITKPAAGRLHSAIVDVLRAGIDNGGTTLRDYRNADGDTGSNQFNLECYGRSGEPCVRCGAELRSRVWDTRTTTWCPVCQRR